MPTNFEGLYPTHIVLGGEGQSETSISALAMASMRLDYSVGGDCDSFYEYLLKYWVYTGKRDEMHHEMYKKAVNVGVNMLDLLTFVGDQGAPGE